MSLLVVPTRRLECLELFVLLHDIDLNIRVTTTAHATTARLLRTVTPTTTRTAMVATITPVRVQSGPMSGVRVC